MELEMFANAVRIERELRFRHPLLVTLFLADRSGEQLAASLQLATSGSALPLNGQPLAR